MINATPVEDKYIYASLLSHFGKGLAYSAKNNIEAAKKELSVVESLLKDSILYAPFTPFSPAIDGAAIAANLLRGSISYKENSKTEAINYFKEAAEREKKMVYNEPKGWLLNPENYLEAPT